MQLAKIMAVFRNEWKQTFSVGRLIGWLLVSGFPILLVLLVLQFGQLGQSDTEFWSWLLFASCEVTCLLQLLIWATPWLHSELDAIERVTILRALREKTHDVVVGVNLLREGLDLPEVSLVAILDADKEGFLRSATSLIQTIGRSARHVNAEVILYADFVTNSMQQAIDETNRRRDRQVAYNLEHDITPASIKKAIRKGIEEEVEARQLVQKTSGTSTEEAFTSQEMLKDLETEMLAAAEALEFERAAELRDRITAIHEGGAGSKTARDSSSRGRRRGRGGRVPKPERP